MAKPKSQWDWACMLRADPSCADEFGECDRLGGFNIARILSAQPQLAKCCNLSKLKALAWIRLLRKQPQFATQCDKWDEISNFAPQLIEKLQVVGRQL